MGLTRLSWSVFRFDGKESYLVYEMYGVMIFDIFPVSSPYRGFRHGDVYVTVSGFERRLSIPGHRYLPISLPFL